MLRETWFDQHPSHPARPPLLQDAYTNSENAWDSYNTACDVYYSLEVYDRNDDDRKALMALLSKALETSAYYSQLYNEAQAVAQATVFMIDQEREAV